VPGGCPSCAAPAAGVAPASPQQGEDARLPPTPEPVLIDGGDHACVALLLELRARIPDVPAGTIIHLIASDPAASIDLPAWCHLTGHAYQGSIGTAPPTYALRTTAVPVATHPPLHGGGAPGWMHVRPSRRQPPDSAAGLDSRSVEGQGADKRHGKLGRDFRHCG